MTENPSSMVQPVASSRRTLSLQVTALFHNYYGRLVTRDGTRPASQHLFLSTIASFPRKDLWHWLLISSASCRIGTRLHSLTRQSRLLYWRWNNKSAGRRAQLWTQKSVLVNSFALSYSLYDREEIDHQLMSQTMNERNLMTRSPLLWHCVTGIWLLKRRNKYSMRWVSGYNVKAEYSVYLVSTDE